jgi:hypothetical protein
MTLLQEMFLLINIVQTYTPRTEQLKFKRLTVLPLGDISHPTF